MLYVMTKKLQKLENLKQSYQKITSIAIPLLLISLSCLLALSWSDFDVYGQNQTMSQNQTIPGPSLTDPNLRVESVASDFDFPTSIAFLAKNDILILEKNTGNVFRLINGNITGPLIHVNVSSKDERGLLGVAVAGQETEDSKDGSLVFLYHTECTKVKGQPKSSQSCTNYIYKYKLDTKNNTLVEPQLILNLTASPGPSHNGGALQMDKKKNLYVTVGDLQSTKFNQNKTGFDTKAQNIVNGTAPDGRAGILRVTQDGKPVGKGILGNGYPLNLYYAYGIKNSFGIGFDPVTNNLWDTENGPQFGDEINLVKRGFNSGWEKVQGIWKLNQTREREGVFKDSNKEVEFVDFSGKGSYSDPEFVWERPVAPTALIFLNSDKLGKQYENDIFVGSAKKGTIFHFDLNDDRDSLDLSGDLADLVYSKKEDSSKIVFGENFGVVTDLKVGPDGYLYVVSGSRGSDEGAVYRIVPNLK
jgi:aldose sugar dehydrogenase